MTPTPNGDVAFGGSHMRSVVESGRTETTAAARLALSAGRLTKGLGRHMIDDGFY